MIITSSCVLYLLLLADLRTARALLEQGKIAEALNQIKAAMRESPDDPEVQYEAGQLFRQLGAERAAALERLAPDSPEAHELLGHALESAGHLDEALAEYKAALQKQPGIRGVHFMIGNVLWKKRDFEAARPEFESELRISPNHAMANLRLGQVLLSVNQPACVDYLRKAVAADDASVEAHQELGKAYRQAGDHRAALSQFQIVAARRPKDESVHAQLAGEYRALGDSSHSNAEWAIHRQLLETKAAAAQRK